MTLAFQHMDVLCYKGLAYYALEESDSLGTKSRRKWLWDYLGGRRSKQTWRNLMQKVMAWIVVVIGRFKQSFR